jgi:hypothetical protein
MDTSRGAPVLAVGVILVGLVVAGPLVPGFEVPARQEPSSGLDYMGNGSLAVTDVDIPDSATLEKGEYGAGSYELRVPDGEVRFENHTGRPILSYKLKIEAISYSRSTAYVLTEDVEAPLTLSLQEDVVDGTQIDAREYGATLTLTRRIDGNGTVVATRNVTVEVDE